MHRATRRLTRPPRAAEHRGVGYERFGRYKLHECLGAGGMAAVHRATVDIGGGVIREVALKRLLPQLADDKKLVEDFIREARIAAQLDHPNIVRILELGRSQGVYFIAMELVQGQSLLQLMKLSILARQQAPIGVVVALLVELCDALDYASNATDTEGEPLHIVHRDLSPSNLIVTEDGHLKIIDFGVAKALSGKFMTSSGAVKGKFGYMSIEALSGKPLDRRADIFSVGVVAWELIAGRRLFKAPNEYDVVMMIQQGASEPPSLYNRECPPELDEIVMRALAKQRDERWPNAAVMRRTLESVRRTYRYGPQDIVGWMQGLLPQQRHLPPVEPAYDIPDHSASVSIANDDDADPPSIVVEPSQVEPAFDDPVEASFAVTPAPRAATRVAQVAEAPSPVSQHDYLLDALPDMPENADFSITPFVAELPPLDGDSIVVVGDSVLVTEHIEDSASFVDEEPSRPDVIANAATPTTEPVPAAAPASGLEVDPARRVSEVTAAVPDVHLRPTQIGAAPVDLAADAPASRTDDTAPAERATLPIDVAESAAAAAELAEGSKRRASISRPPSTLAKRNKEQRLRTLGESSVSRSSAPLITEVLPAAPEPAGASDSDLEATTIAALPGREEP